MPNHSHSGGQKKAGAAGQTADRRQTDRFPFSAVADVTEVSSRSKVEVRIADIGRQGCYADSLNVFPIGTHVHLRIRHAGEVCHISATVIYSLSGMGMGLNFAPLQPDVEAILMRWLAAARGEPWPPLAGLPEPREAAAPVASAGPRVVARLIKLMMRKGLLSESESKDLLDDMAGRGRSGEDV